MGRLQYLFWLLTCHLLFQVCEVAVAPPRPAFHRPQMSGTPLFLQANRRHADRHLLNGDAGSPSSNDLREWALVVHVPRAMDAWCDALRDTCSQRPGPPHAESHVRLQSIHRAVTALSQHSSDQWRTSAMRISWARPLFFFSSLSKTWLGCRCWSFIKLLLLFGFGGPKRPPASQTKSAQIPWRVNVFFFFFFSKIYYVVKTMEEFSNLCVPTELAWCGEVFADLLNKLWGGPCGDLASVSTGRLISKGVVRRANPYSTLGLNSQRTNISENNLVELAVPSHAFALRGFSN